MKKSIIIGIMILMLVLLASCVQNVKVKAKPDLGVPVSATSIAVSDFTVGIEDGIKSVLPGAEIITVDGTKAIRYATGLVVDGGESFKEIDSFSTSIIQEISIPSIDDIDPINIEVPSMDFDPQSITMNLPDLGSTPESTQANIGAISIPEGVSLPSTTLYVPVVSNESREANTTLTSDTFSKLYFSQGNLVFHATNNSITTDATIEIIVENSDGTKLRTGSVQVAANTTDQEIDIDLTDKMLTSSITLTLSVTYGDGNDDGTKTLDVTLNGFSPDTKIKAAEGIEFETGKSITQEINPGFGSTKFSTVTISGSFDVGIQFPSTWQNISTEYEATIVYSYSNDTKEILIAHKDVSENGPLNFDNVSIPYDANGVFKFTVDSTYTNESGQKANVNFEDSPTFTITPDITINSIEGFEVENTQTMDLPDEIESVTFMSGSFELKITDTKIASIVASFEYNKGDGTTDKVYFNVEDTGEATLNLAGITMSGNLSVDATVLIDKISLDFDSGNSDTLNAEVNFSEPKISRVTVNKEIKQDIPIPEDIKSVIFGSGTIEITLLNAKFTGISGNLIYQTNSTPLQLTSEGSATIDMTDLELGAPSAEINITSIAIESDAGISLGDNITANVELKEPKIKHVEIKSSDSMDISESQFVDFAGLKEVLNSITFTDPSTILIEWDNKLPVDINSKIAIPELNVNDQFVISGESSKVINFSGEVNLDNGLNFTFEASPQNYDGEVLTIDISNEDDYLEMGSKYTLEATVSLDYNLNASVKPINTNIITEDNPLNFEIPISEETTLTLNDIELDGFSAKILGNIPQDLVSANNKITLTATYTVDNVKKVKSVDVVLDKTNIEKDITDFLLEVLKGKDVVMSMKSNDITANITSLNNFKFSFKIDMTVPLSFTILGNEPLTLLEIKGENDVLGRDENSESDDTLINSILGDDGSIKIHIKYNNTSGLSPEVILIGRNKFDKQLMKKTFTLKDGSHEDVIEIKSEDIKTIMNTIPYYLDTKVQINPGDLQSFLDNGKVDIKIWLEVKTDVDMDLMEGGE
ncbi:hypothetical protein Marpi_2018 [Marinitoga piezophila KA3]|uniref:Uncharacterized protein n=1 Tax=Marinitoga piezophila (strain DSM 14283 / JCM 11233 / KA3) TaxID=443254 RepID=H2J724_MARPK|nr:MULTISPECIES: hypothetical protein [Marinitoga]AEX86394.1 hypothetical protein Marpi_2018 [Marinitoga piezophila KA3]APT76785.1 hypothetical protein LN42_10670 [Marinitoga sp. 1137]